MDVTMINNYKLSTSIITVLALILTACGGGSDSTSTDTPPPISSPPTTKTFSGKVIDGYVDGATIWLDLNGDGKFNEQHEPSALSTNAGDYALELTEAEQECLAYTTTYVDVPVGAIDEDLGEVTEAYQMSFPPSIDPISDDDIRNISPLTTVVWGLLRKQLEGSGKGQLSCDDLKADSELRNEIKTEVIDVIRGLVGFYNISADQIYADFIANNDSTAYDLAQSIVKGLKASYKHRLSLKEQYPDAEINVMVYQDAKKDLELGFERAWYRDELIYLGTEDFIELTKLKENLNDVDIVLTTLHELGQSWGDQSLNGWLSIREDVYINPDLVTYRCGNIERISFDTNNIHYELGNIVPTVNFPSLAECKNNNFENPYERVYSTRYTEENIEYGSEFSFRDDTNEFSALNNWINIKDKSNELTPSKLIEYFETIGYRFDDNVLIDFSSWRKSQRSEGVSIHKTHDGKWTKETELEDGTRKYECSTDGINWSLCDG
jgi:hypothetical protein